MSLATIPSSQALATLADNPIDDNTLAVHLFSADPDVPRSSRQPVAEILVTGRKTAETKLQTPQGLSARQTVRELLDQVERWKSQRLVPGTDHDKWLIATNQTIWKEIEAFAKKRNRGDLRLAMVRGREDWETLGEQGCAFIPWSYFRTDTGTEADTPPSRPITASNSTHSRQAHLKLNKQLRIDKTFLHAASGCVSFFPPLMLPAHLLLMSILFTLSLPSHCPFALYRDRQCCSIPHVFQPSMS